MLHYDVCGICGTRQRRSCRIVINSFLSHRTTLHTTIKQRNTMRQRETAVRTRAARRRSRPSRRPPPRRRRPRLRSHCRFASGHPPTDTRFTNIFGASISEMTVQRSPPSTSAPSSTSADGPSPGRHCHSTLSCYTVILHCHWLQLF